MDADTVLRILRSHAEDTGKDGWAMVYLDNASGDLDLTPHQFAGWLSVLEKRGLYRPYDNYAWGEVLVEGAPA
jgi:hypothetical protein